MGLGMACEPWARSTGRARLLPSRSCCLSRLLTSSPTVIRLGRSLVLPCNFEQGVEPRHGGPGCGASPAFEDARQSSNLARLKTDKGLVRTADMHRKVKVLIARWLARRMESRTRRLRRALRDHQRAELGRIRAADRRARGLRLYAAWSCEERETIGYRTVVPLHPSSQKIAA